MEFIMAQQEMMLINLIDTNTANNIRQLEQKLRALRQQVAHKLEAYHLSPSDATKNFEQHLQELMVEIDQSIASIANLMNFIVRNKEEMLEFKRSQKKLIDNFIQQVSENLANLNKLQSEFK